VNPNRYIVFIIRINALVSFSSHALEEYDTQFAI